MIAVLTIIDFTYNLYINLGDRPCDRIVDESDIADAILFFILRAIGTILWTYPLIYAFWIRIPKILDMKEEDDEDEYIRNMFGDGLSMKS